ncbi:MAG: histidinol dehydrogenase [Omnitrophica WOR_2 bacterium RIFCSPHIGHO2_02_FULL_68_15]|nr:MAG: histidinol dehydrogenase [Omnitrophica WOR_2 bacterium RIFCSPHIGHO2_02_FULL_68_15]
MKTIRFGTEAFAQLCRRGNGKRRRQIEDKVRRILEDVRVNGDDAVLKYTRQFDKVRLMPRQLKVTEAEMSGAYQNIEPEFVSALKLVIENVRAFYHKQAPRSWQRTGDDGILLGERCTPLDRVGVYVPAAQAPLVSTVYMTVLPARLAGVKEVYMVTPPTARGTIEPHLLVVANLLKVTAVYKVGGAQAIGALAFGTKTVPRVDKIVGPGNAYVTEAKRQVFGDVDIDMTAGPTEIALIADQSSVPEFVAADLEAENEHAGGFGVLITPSRTLARQIRSRVARGTIVMTRSLDEAAAAANALAPEHLELHVKSPEALAKKIRHAGAIFLGPYSPASIGDYVAGPSHVLPTGGTARFFSGLGVHDFIKRTHVISYSRRALEKVRGHLERMATIEGLVKHMESVKVRFERGPDGVQKTDSGDPA